MNRKLYIFGAGGLGKEIGAYIKHHNSDYFLRGYFDDSSEGNLPGLAPIFGSIEMANELSLDSNFVIGIGDPSIKKEILRRVSKKFHYPSIVQPHVYFGDESSIKISDGAVVCSGSSLTTGISINPHVLINLNCSIGHDVSIGQFSSIMPGVNIGGNVKIGEGAFIGSGATVLQNVKIGARALVGAGAVVNRDVNPGERVVGVPARPMKFD